MKDLYQLTDGKLFGEFLDEKVGGEEGIKCAECGKIMKRHRKHMFVCDECFNKIDNWSRA